MAHLTNNVNTYRPSNQNIWHGTVPFTVTSQPPRSPASTYIWLEKVQDTYLITQSFSLHWSDMVTDPSQKIDYLKLCATTLILLDRTRSQRKMYLFLCFLALFKDCSGLKRYTFTNCCAFICIQPGKGLLHTCPQSGTWLLDVSDVAKLYVGLAMYMVFLDDLSVISYILDFSAIRVIKLNSESDAWLHKWFGRCDPD